MHGTPLFNTNRCWMTHKPLVIPYMGTDYRVWGGSCTVPPSDDIDIFVGLDTSMRTTNRAYPWVCGEEFLYPIQNLCAPTDVQEFKQLIRWLKSMVVMGEKVYIGCIGGHGRTGLVLAALYYEMTGDKQAIKIVRETYCHRAVESQLQCNWLREHFGMHAYKGVTTGYKPKGFRRY
ncbi:hypothetical protein [Vibrio phage V-YDF132]|nr:hypothetical protein [Vibrio phage V-YDF132]